GYRCRSAYPCKGARCRLRTSCNINMKGAEFHIGEEESMRLDGKIALVTGASSGLGMHFARVLARHGAALVLAARRVPPLAELAAEIEASGGKAHALALDVADADSVEEAFATLDSQGIRPDILINNAGTTDTRPALDTAAADWDRVVDTNLRGAFLVARAAAQRMRDGGAGGNIVNIASILSLRVAGSVAAYTASKAGLLRLTEALALEWARHGIRVNALCPGYIATDLNREFFETDAGKAMIRRIPQRRLGTPEDLD